MKVLTNLLKFIIITILTICMISVGVISIASSTIFSKSYIIEKLEETNFYAETYKLVESNFENYIYQSGLDEDVLKNICTEEKVKQDINIMLSNIYEGTNQKIDTTDIEKNLNTNIEKSGIKNDQNENAIKQFVTHICEEYTNTLVHTNYEKQINDMYIKTVDILNLIYNIISIVLVLDLILIIIINLKKISKIIQYFGISLVATATFGLSVWQIIISKIDIKGIKIFNDVFSNTIVTIIKDIIEQIVALSVGFMFIGIIFISIYALITNINILKKQKETNKNNVKEN